MAVGTVSLPLPTPARTPLTGAQVWLGKWDLSTLSP